MTRCMACSQRSEFCRCHGGPLENVLEERDQLRADLATARDEAARLRGELIDVRKEESGWIERDEAITGALRLPVNASDIMVIGAIEALRAERDALKAELTEARTTIDVWKRSSAYEIERLKGELATHVRGIVDRSEVGDALQCTRAQLQDAREEIAKLREENARRDRGDT